MPAPRPPPPPGPWPATDYRTLPRRLLGAPTLDWVFARDGLGTQGGPWMAREYNNRDGDLDYMSLLQPGREAMAFYADPQTRPDLGDPFAIEPDGLHIRMAPFTPAMKARAWPQVRAVQEKAYVTGRLLTQNPQGPPRAERERHAGFWRREWGLDRDDGAGGFEFNRGSCVSVKMRSPDLRGTWGQVCGYSYWGSDGLLEIDIVEALKPVTTYTIHQWPKRTRPAWPKIDSGDVAHMADGRPAPDPKRAAVEFTLLWTPDNVLRWYLDGRLARTWNARGTAFGTDVLFLSLANQAHRGEMWRAAGPLAARDLPRADVVFEYARAWTVG